MRTFSEELLSWYDRNKRELPFRGTKDPYRVWLSEIMLQQTRTSSVFPYYERFLAQYPTVSALAEAPEEDVLKLWEGLGYYSRARNLLKTARLVADKYGGQFPSDVRALRQLPGIGPYTAAAVASIVFSLPEPAIDGNLTRVLARCLGIREDVSLPSVRQQMEAEARKLISPDRPGDFNQALMDLGASVCVPGTPDCAACPLCARCSACREQDAEWLPVLPRKAPPALVPLNVLIILYGQKVLLLQRKEALLKGMYVFFLTGDSPSAALSRLHIKAAAAQAGEARHVFTHLVWEMKLFICRAEAVPEKLLESFYTVSQMEALPIPAAMRAARQLALSLLTEPAPGGNPT